MRHTHAITIIIRRGGHFGYRHTHNPRNGHTVGDAEIEPRHAQTGEASVAAVDRCHDAVPFVGRCVIIAGYDDVPATETLKAIGARDDREVARVLREQAYVVMAYIVMAYVIIERPLASFNSRPM